LEADESDPEDIKRSMSAGEHKLFMTVWVIIVIYSLLIFLTFMIAQVSDVYAQVKEEINALIYKERAALINEAEDIIPNFIKRGK